MLSHGTFSTFRNTQFTHFISIFSQPALSLSPSLSLSLLLYLSFIFLSHSFTLSSDLSKFLYLSVLFSLSHSFPLFSDISYFFSFFLLFSFCRTLLFSGLISLTFSLTLLLSEIFSALRSLTLFLSLYLSFNSYSLIYFYLLLSVSLLKWRSSKSCHFFLDRRSHLTYVLGIENSGRRRHRFENNLQREGNRILGELIVEYTYTYT